MQPLAFDGQKQGWKTLEGDLLVVHCFCMCGGGALLEGLLGVSRSMEREFLSVVSFHRFVSLECICCTLVSSVRDILLCYVNQQ